jgi:hypothetical protein
VDNPDSLENVGTKWMAEISEHCPGVKIVLVALKCDLREEHEKDDNEANGSQPRHMVTYQEGLAVARRIGALRYLGMFYSNSLASRTLETDQMLGRMLSNAQPGRQRSLHRSCASSASSQASEIEREQQVRHHVALPRAQSRDVPSRLRW